MTLQSNIQKWFGSQKGGSLYLPDGWYGRPYDNQHNLTSIREDRNKIVIELDNQIVLMFDGLRSVNSRERELIFCPFDKLVFEARGIDNNIIIKDYKSGEVKIISAPG